MSKSNGSLSYGLNIPKKPPARNAGAPPERNLASLLSAKKQTTVAEELDPSIYDYDGVYDSLHAAKETAPKPTGPRYMANLMAAAETRKRDQLRAKEKMLAKEREAEGEEFAEKEKFVTGAYKAQQAEVARLEEEERQREDRERARRKMGGGGMKELYKGLLDREERRHESAVKAVEDMKTKGPNARTATVEDDTIDEDEEKAKASGAALNEDGQVVDKRELLSAGLNIKAKPKSVNSSSAIGQGPPRSESMSVLSGGRGSSKQAMRERQTRMLEAQLEAAAKRVAEDEQVEQEALVRAAKSRKTDSDISSAKERYLARKREAEAAKAAGGGEA